MQQRFTIFMKRLRAAACGLAVAASAAWGGGREAPVAAYDTNPWTVVVSNGVEVTLTAPLIEGLAFHHWEGGPTGEARFVNPYTYTPATDGLVTSVMGALVEVAPGADLVQAVAGAGAFGVVRAAAGTYALTNQIVMGTCRLEGAGRDDATGTILQCASAARGLYLNSPFAFVSGVKVTGSRAKVSGLGVYIDQGGGTIVDSRVTDNQTTQYHLKGAGIYMSSADALVARCIVDRNAFHFGPSGNDYGGGICIDTRGGVVENCLVYGNESYRFGGGICAYAGTIRNCTLYGNGAVALGGNLDLRGPVSAYNTILDAGWCLFAADRWQRDWNAQQTAYKNGLINCACPRHPVGQGGLEGRLDFANPDAFDFAPAPGSYAINAGADAGTWASLPLDLNGNPRVVGSAVDLGCIEFQYSASVVGMRIEPGAVFGGSNAVFTAVSIGGATTHACTWTIKDADGAVVDTFEGASATRAFAAPGRFTVELAADGLSCIKVGGLRVGVLTNYVSQTGSATAPYATPATAANDLAEALDEALDGATIFFPGADETYVMTSETRIHRPVVIESAHGAASIVFTPAAGKKIRLFTINDPGAVLRGVTLTGGCAELFYGRGLLIGGSGGLVDRCIVSNCYDIAYHQVGGGVAMMGPQAVLRGTLVADNRLVRSISEDGAGVYLMDGTVENCLIRDNTAYQHGAGVYASNKGNVINCTIVCNTAYGLSATGCGGGIYRQAGLGTGRIANCAFYGNSASKDTGGGAPDWFCADAAARGAFVNCAFSAAAPNDTCFVPGSFLFTDPARGDFSLMSSSPLVDAGEDNYLGEWLKTDFGGVNPRVIGLRGDIGCYEADTMAYLCEGFLSPVEAFVGTPFVFAAVTNGAPEGAVFTWRLYRTGGETPVATIQGAVVTNAIAEPAHYTVTLTPSFGTASKTWENGLHVAVRTNYVVATWDAGHTPVLPYDAWVCAATNIADALDEAIDGATIVLGKGRYPTDVELCVFKGVTMVSQGGPEATAVYSSKRKSRVFHLDHPYAKLVGLTISNGCSSAQYIGGGGVVISPLGGTVENCTITRNVAGDNVHTPGGGITCESRFGRIDRCRIFFNSSKTAGKTGGGGVNMMYGALRNSFIYGNIALAGAGVFVRANDVVVENCTIVSNTVVGVDQWELARGGGLAIEGAATIRNTLVYGNKDVFNTLAVPTIEQDIAINRTVAASNAVQVSHCLLPAALGNASITGDPAFVDYRPGAGVFDCRLRGKSPCRDAGAYVPEWMPGALDCGGNPRILGRRVDIGCFETDRSIGFYLILK
jgi:hypothetical protein